MSGHQPDTVRRVQELEEYCYGYSDDALSLEGMQEKIAGIPPDAVRGSDFFHWACRNEGVTLGMIECVLDAFPDAVQSIDRHGRSPLHCSCSNENIDPGIVRLLLDSVDRRDNRGALPLHVLCQYNDDDDLRHYRDSVRLLFDAYPEAVNVGDDVGRTPIDLATPEVRRFLEDQLAYARLAEVATHDGWLLLHLALRNDASLGAIKLLIAGNPDFLQASANQSASPLHIACEYSTAGVVNYLLEQGVPSVSEPDSNGKLPVHLLWESDRVDRNSVEYLEAVWRLLLAHPEIVAP